MVTEALPDVPQVPPSGLGVPLARLSVMTTWVGSAPWPRKTRNGLVAGMMTWPA